MFDYSHIEIAKNFGIENSQCSRRKYGTIIMDDSGKMVFGANVRVGRCCTDFECIRDRRETSHSVNVEIGSEIHSEQAVLVDWHREQDIIYQMLLVGVNRRGELLYDRDSYPCHVCALMIKYAGFAFIWIPQKSVFGKTEPVPVSISEVIEYHEQLY